MYNKELYNIINNYNIEKQKEIILNKCGVTILKIIENNLSDYKFEIKEITEKEGLSISYIIFSLPSKK